MKLKKLSNYQLLQNIKDQAKVIQSLRQEIAALKQKADGGRP